MNPDYVFEKGKMNSTLDEIESLVKRLRAAWNGVPVQGKELQDYLEHFKSNEWSSQAYERKCEAMKNKEFVLVDWVEHTGCFELLKNKLETLRRLCH